MKTARIWFGVVIFLFVVSCTSYRCTPTGTTHTEMRPIYGYHTVITRSCSYGRRSNVCYDHESTQTYIEYWYPAQVPDETCQEVGDR